MTGSRGDSAGIIVIGAVAAAAALLCPEARHGGTLPRMSSLPDDRETLDPGEAYQMCVREIHQAHPDYERAQVYAILNLEETLRAVSGQVADLAQQIMLASRR